MPLVPGRIYQNTTVTIPGTFKDADGTLIDPDTVVFKIRSPAGTETTYTFGTDDEIEKESTGLYHASFLVTEEAGRWFWRWQVYDSTDYVVYAAVEGSVVVQASAFFDASEDAYRR